MGQIQLGIRLIKISLPLLQQCYEPLGLDSQQSCNFKIFLTPELSARLNLQPRETVGVLTGIATGGTLIAILLLIMGMACKYCFFKRTRKGANLRRRTSSRSSKREQPLQERISRIGDGPEVGGGVRIINTYVCVLLFYCGCQYDSLLYIA